MNLNRQWLCSSLAEVLCNDGALHQHIFCMHHEKEIWRPLVHLVLI